MIAGGAIRWAFAELARATSMVAVEPSVRIVLMVYSPSLEAENPNDATLTGVSRDIRHERGRRPDVCWVTRQHVTGEEEPVATEARVDGNVLLAIGTAEGDGIPDHARPHLELGEPPSGAGVHRLEPAVECAVKGHASGGHQ